ncbi:MAG: DUF6629 family protein [Bacteroidia bacterium]
MCFSAGASFGASVILSVAGVLSIRKVKTKSQIFFASIPFIFAVQQFTEGIVWLSLSDPAYLHWKTTSVYLFLFFAHVLWPVWVPVSVLLLEKKPGRKMGLFLLTLIGGFVSFFLFYFLNTYSPLAQIVSCHIQYRLIVPLSSVYFSGMFYFIPTVIPLFLSGVKRMWVFGIAIFMSYVITELFYVEFVISVWCFFAATLSVIVLYTMDRITQDNGKTAYKTIRTAGLKTELF